jgi:hypothetical protein
MANSLSAVINTILARGLQVLRDRTVMPALASREEGGVIAPAQKGQTIQVPIYQDMTVESVSPSSVLVVPSDTTPTYANITLDQWKKTDFHLTDKEMFEVQNMPDFLMKKVDKAANALAREANGYILGFIDDAPTTGKPGGVFNAVGDAGTTPFVSTPDILNLANGLLNSWNAPQEERYGVLSYQAGSNLKSLTALRDASQRGNVSTILDGQIGRVFGVDFYEDGQIPAFTTSGAVNTATLNKTDSSSNALVIKNEGTVATAVFKVGDIIKIAGNFQTFMVAASVAIGSSVSATVTVVPSVTGKIDGAVSTGAAITKHGSQRLNILFQRGAFAFANRPLGAVPSLGGVQGVPVLMQELTDPVSGLSMRLEITRQYKQYVWQFDMLYGSQLIRPELACRIMG